MSFTYILDAEKFNNLEGFYTTIYGLMDWQEDWAPGHNLDALNDVLYGGFGPDPVILIWQQAGKSKAELGLAATQAFYQHKIDQGKPYNVIWAQEQLDALNAGEGQTLFDIIVEIIQSHQDITLVLEN
jgi:RNAse (barnase) inhibitor barstar